MKPSISPIRSIIVRPAALALALLASMAVVPAYAGNACALFDGDPNTEDDGGSTATGDDAVSCGVGAAAPGVSAIAFGSWFDDNNDDLAVFDVDTNNDGILDASSELTRASGNHSVAIGAAAWATGDQATAVGVGNVASGLVSTAVGHKNSASGYGASAFGLGNSAEGGLSVAIGLDNHVIGDSSTAVGTLNSADGEEAIALGYANKANGANSAAIGSNSDANGQFSTALGHYAFANGDHSLAIGSYFDADNNGVQEEDMVVADGMHSAAIGPGARSVADRSLAMGAGSQALIADSVAIGSFSIADRGSSVSVGAVGVERQIINVAAGTQATDAVNKAQLDAKYAQATAYTDTAVALGGTAANAYTDNREEAIRGDMEAGDAQTLSAANAYTDQKFVGFDAGVLNDRFDRIDQRFGQQDRRISRVGALSAAMSQSSAIAAMGGGARGSYGIGAAVQGGEKALAFGWGKRVGERHVITLGGAFSGSERSASVGFGGEL